MSADLKPSYKRFEAIIRARVPDMSIQDIANYIGISRSAISQWRSGSIGLKVSHLYKIASLTGTRIEDFFEDLPLLERNFNLKELEPVQIKTPEQALSPEETAIIDKYRKLNGDQRLEFISKLTELYTISEKKVIGSLAE